MRLSADCSRTSRQRDAPSARRTAISDCLVVPRASTRFARFVQATARTRTTSETIVRPARRTSVSSCVIAVIDFAFQRRSIGRAGLNGIMPSRLAAIAPSSADAVSVVRVKARRPNTSKWSSRGAVTDTPRGIQTLVPGTPPLAPSKGAATTPIISNGSPDMRIVRPTIPRSAPKRERHSEWLRTTTLARSSSSSVWMVLPIAASIPTVEK